MSSVSIPIVPTRQGQRLSLHPKPSCCSSGRSVVHHVHLLLRVPHILDRSSHNVYHVEVASSSHLLKMSLPSLGNHLMNLHWVGYQCPDFFISFLVVSHMLQDSRLGSVFILDPFKEQRRPCSARFLEFHHFVFPPAPSVFLMHLVRQHDHLFVSCRQGFSPSHLTHVFLAPEFAHRWEQCYSFLSMCSFSLLCSQGLTPKVSTFNPLPHVTRGSDYRSITFPLPDLHIDFAHKPWRRLLAHKFSYKPPFPPFSCRRLLIDLFTSLASGRHPCKKASESISLASSKTCLSHLSTNSFQSPSPILFWSSAATLNCLTITICVAVYIVKSISTTTNLCLGTTCSCDTSNRLTTLSATALAKT